MSKHGNTSSAVALATQMAIDHNMKILLLSTSLNDNIIKDSFWKEDLILTEMQAFESTFKMHVV